MRTAVALPAMGDGGPSHDRRTSHVFVNNPHLLALLVAHHRERLIETGTGMRRPARRLRRRRRA